MTIKKVASARSLTFSQWVVKPATEYYSTIQKIKSQAKMKNKKFRKSAIKIALIIIGAIIISYFVFTWKQIAL